MMTRDEDPLTPEEEWSWFFEQPANWNPAVVEAGGYSAVRLFTHHPFRLYETIYANLDVYLSGLTARHYRVPMATGRGGKDF